MPGIMLRHKADYSTSCSLNNITNFSDRMMGQESCSINGHISLKGTFLVRCKILSAQLKVSEQKVQGRFQKLFAVLLEEYIQVKVIIRFLCFYIA